MGRGLAGGRDGLWEEDGSARRSKKLSLKFRAQERDRERGRARRGGEKGLLAQSGVCRGRRTSASLSAGSCFLSAPSSSAPAQLAAGGTRPLTPLLPAAPGAPAQSLAALNAPCVVCAHQMLHPRCCQSPRGCDPAAAPTQRPAPQKHPPRAGDVLGAGGSGTFPGLGAVGPLPAPPCPGHESSEPFPVHTPRLSLLPFRAEDRPRGDISCPLCHVPPSAPRRDEGDLQGCSRAWGW